MALSHSNFNKIGISTSQPYNVTVGILFGMETIYIHVLSLLYLNQPLFPEHVQILSFQCYELISCKCNENTTELIKKKNSNKWRLMAT